MDTENDLTLGQSSGPNNKLSGNVPQQIHQLGQMAPVPYPASQLLFRVFCGKEVLDIENQYGAPGGLGQLSVRLGLRSRSHGP